jgi:hypothetical protein
MPEGWYPHEPGDPFYELDQGVRTRSFARTCAGGPGRAGRGTPRDGLRAPCPEVWGEGGAMNVLAACLHGKRGPGHGLP